MTRTFFTQTPTPPIQYFIELLRQDGRNSGDASMLESLKESASNYVKTQYSKSITTPVDDYFLVLNKYKEQASNGCAMSPDQWVTIMTQKEYNLALKFIEENYGDLIQSSKDQKSQPLFSEEEESEQEQTFCAIL